MTDPVRRARSTREHVEPVREAWLETGEPRDRRAAPAAGRHAFGRDELCPPGPVGGSGERLPPFDRLSIRINDTRIQGPDAG